MKDKFETEFNTLLVETFHLILQTELKMIKKIVDIDLSLREIHLIEVISKKERKITISNVAKTFQITLASVTVMVNKLLEKGFIIKNKNEGDGRYVFLSLTDKGHKINQAHVNFHQTMIDRIVDEFTDSERSILGKVANRLNDFFKNELKNE